MVVDTGRIQMVRLNLRLILAHFGIVIVSATTGEIYRWFQDSIELLDADGVTGAAEFDDRFVDCMDETWGDQVWYAVLCRDNLEEADDLLGELPESLLYFDASFIVLVHQALISSGIEKFHQAFDKLTKLRIPFRQNTLDHGRLRLSADH